MSETTTTGPARRHDPVPPGGVGRQVQSHIYLRGAMGRRPAVPVSPRRLEAAARRRLSARAFGYIAGSAGMETTARANRAALDRVRIVPRRLVDVSRRDQVGRAS